jgi:protease I
MRRRILSSSFLEKIMAKIAILLERGYEDLELQYPRLRLREAGHVVDVIGPVAGETYVGKNGYPQKAEKSAGDARAGDYAMLVIPGGSSPDQMRRHEHMVRLAREFDAAKLPMAAICHGPWMLCSTGALRGRRCTSYMSIIHDVVNAGGKWVDEECVVDGPIITARTPDDLPAFMKAILQCVSEGKAEGTRGKPVAPGWVKGMIQTK